MIKTKKYKIKISPSRLYIIYEVILVHIYNRYKWNDLFWRTPVGTASVITTNICLTKDLNKNVIGASITGRNWEIIENLQKVFDQFTNSGL